jgi:hypothetical protein
MPSAFDKTPKGKKRYEDALDKYYARQKGKAPITTQSPLKLPGDKTRQHT